MCAHWKSLGKGMEVSHEQTDKGWLTGLAGRGDPQRWGHVGMAASVWVQGTDLAPEQSQHHGSNAS